MSAQVVLRIAAADLVFADIVVSVPAAPTLSPLAANYVEQPVSGLLSSAAKLDLGFSMDRRALMPRPGSRGWRACP
ncbi:hypothetical protein [Streptomyces sp. NPDC088847]|uniref:hypothetical protein n=1 Tax=Streptomyces sp. NPDC088847 TaxID=3365909 RepID=UPI0038207979